MEFLIKAAQLLLSLSILIVLHELGHFLPARWFKIRVEKFYLFFDAGFSLFKFKKGETEYGIGWLPLGGYVKIAGMIDESMDNENLSEEPQPWEFRSKPAWQRLIVMIGGVTVNLILGFLIYMMLLFTWGQDYVKPGDTLHGFAPSEIMQELGFEYGDHILKVNEEAPFDVLDINKALMLHGVTSITVEHPNGSTETIAIPEGTDMKLFINGERGMSPRMKYTTVQIPEDDSPAGEAGIQTGDKIISIDGSIVEFWDQVASNLKRGLNDVKEAFPDSVHATQVTVLRDGTELSFAVVSEEGLLGVGVSAPNEEDAASLDQFTFIRSHKDYEFLESIGSGFGYGLQTLSDYVTQFKYVFTAKGSTSIGGFGAIGSMFPAAWDWQVFWERTAFISIILAFMNILPIPALDGGHVIFLIYEMISGKAPSDKFLIRAQVVGMMILLSLLLYANGMDIYRYFFK
jgi:regulator of sigma E protease